MDNRSNIILVLETSIKLGKEVDFNYHPIYEKHKEINHIHNFHTTMKAKVELFKNLDEKSYTFQRILDTAKIALINLQQGKGYNYYCSELILKFNQLEDCFKRKLKPIGVRVIDREVKKENNTKVDKIEYEELNLNADEEEELVPITRDAEFINNNITGKKLQNKILKERDIKEALTESKFID